MSDNPLRKNRPSEADKKAKREARRLGTGMMLPGLVAEQKRMLSSRTGVATMRPQPASYYKRYVLGPDVSTHRAGANDFLLVPSRFNDVLRYRDGRAVPITSTELKA